MAGTTINNGNGDGLRPDDAMPRRNAVAAAQEALRAAYRELEGAKVGESREVGAPLLLIFGRVGILQRSFLLPTGRTLGKPWSFGGGEGITPTKVTVVKGDGVECDLSYRCDYQTESGKAEVATFYWKGGKLVSEVELHQEKLRAAYAELKEAKPGDSREVGALAPLMSGIAGQLQIRFLLPTGRTLGKRWSFGGRENTTPIKVIVVKGDGVECDLSYRCEYRTEDGKLEAAMFYWKGGSFVTEVELHQGKLRTAYSELADAKPGESRDVGGLAPLIASGREAQLLTSFLLPSDKSLGERWSFGGRQNATPIKVAVVKGDGIECDLYFRCEYQTEDGELEAALFYWKGGRLVTEVGLHQENLRTAYAELATATPGESRDVGSLGPLISGRWGQLKKSFLLPNDRSCVQQWSFGGANNITPTKVTVVRGDGAACDLSYRCEYKTQDGQLEAATFYWKGGRLLTKVELHQARLRTAYTELADARAGESRDVGALAPLVSGRMGQLQMSFLLPNDKILGKQWNFGGGINAAPIKVIVVKGDGVECDLYYRCEYKTVSGKVDAATFYWKGGKLLSEVELHQEKLRTAYAALKDALPGESQDVGALTPLIYGRVGLLQMRFPLPNGELLGRQWSFGGGANITPSKVTVVKGDGIECDLSYRCDYQTESGEAGAAAFYWKGGKLLTEVELHQEKLRTAYATLKDALPGVSQDVGALTPLINGRWGKLQRSFPLPNGAPLGEQWWFGRGRNFTPLGTTLTLIEPESATTPALYRFDLNLTRADGRPGRAAFLAQGGDLTRLAPEEDTRRVLQLLKGRLLEREVLVALSPLATGKRTVAMSRLTGETRVVALEIEDKAVVGTRFGRDGAALVESALRYSRIARAERTSAIPTVAALQPDWIPQVASVVAAAAAEEPKLAAVPVLSVEELLRANGALPERFATLSGRMTVADTYARMGNEEALRKLLRDRDLKAADSEPENDDPVSAIALLNTQEWQSGVQRLLKEPTLLTAELAELGRIHSLYYEESYHLRTVAVLSYLSDNTSDSQIHSRLEAMYPGITSPAHQGLWSDIIEYVRRQSALPEFDDGGEGPYGEVKPLTQLRLADLAAKVRGIAEEPSTPRQPPIEPGQRPIEPGAPREFTPFEELLHDATRSEPFTYLDRAVAFVEANSSLTPDERHQLRYAAGAAIIRLASRIPECFERSPLLSELKSDLEALHPENVDRVLGELETQRIQSAGRTMRADIILARLRGLSL